MSRPTFWFIASIWKTCARSTLARSPFSAMSSLRCCGRVQTPPRERDARRRPWRLSASRTAPAEMLARRTGRPYVAASPAAQHNFRRPQPVMKSTVLHSAHLELGARMVPFAGWDMPVQYAGILDEVAAVRQRAGLFDLGHMGRVFVRGRDAEALLQRVQTNDAAQIAPGAIRYSMFLADDGGILDDILV